MTAIEVLEKYLIKASPKYTHTEIGILAGLSRSRVSDCFNQKVDKRTDKIIHFSKQQLAYILHNIKPSMNEKTYFNFKKELEPYIKP